MTTAPLSPPPKPPAVRPSGGRLLVEEWQPADDRAPSGAVSARTACADPDDAPWLSSRPTRIVHWCRHRSDFVLECGCSMSGTELCRRPLAL